MNLARRIGTIYRKELIDILRDHRTLVAMILVPIVLYPLLMLGSVQAVSYQKESMEKEKFLVGVVNEGQGRSLRDLIDADGRALDAKRNRADGGPTEEAEGRIDEPLTEAVTVLAMPSREVLQQRIRDRVLHAGVVFAADAVVDALNARNDVEILCDKEEVRSAYIADRLEGMFARIAYRWVEARKQRAGLPAAFDEPFTVKYNDLAAPSSILGQILPLILILMTITGAIYPAIDLTAGERERGTLESLMVCPVPVIELIVGKFLVVTTVAIMGAMLNLASVSATVYFGGFDKVISTSGDSLPVGKMLFILLCLIPFAVLMSAIMIAVCSYARTFKEAQNYVTPVILAVLIPGGIAALPATRMEGVMLVMPVGNMVLLARDLLLGAAVPLWHVVLVLFSTTLYAVAAVAIATKVFGQESVVFADAGSLQAAFKRSLIKPAAAPSVSMSLLFVALLFPLWFFIQSALSPLPQEDARRLLMSTGWLMPVCFIVLPLAVLTYWKVDLVNALSLRRPRLRYVLAGVLIGCSAWVPTQELMVLQHALLGAPQSVVQSAEILVRTLRALPLPLALLFIAVVPAVSEEWLFRGFLLGGLRASMGRWPAILASAAVFAVFHFVLFRFAVTGTLGVVLAYVCWQSRSLVPGMVAHFLHNGLGTLSAVDDRWYRALGITADSEATHLPVEVLLFGGALFVAGLALCARADETGEVPSCPVATAPAATGAGAVMTR
ncbi:MAG: CPBP family intramembrane metalloprotease [Planctomycetes bacterium]|nr:CPBP family intramembrane metalloprotease [Planctomycetota bacterium]